MSSEITDIKDNLSHEEQVLWWLKETEHNTRRTANWLTFFGVITIIGGIISLAVMLLPLLIPLLMFSR